MEMEGPQLFFFESKQKYPAKKTNIALAASAMSCGLALAAAPCRTGLPLASRAVPIVASLQSSVGGGFVSAAVKMGEGLIAKAIRSPLISVAALLLLAASKRPWRRACAQARPSTPRCAT